MRPPESPQTTRGPLLMDQQVRILPTLKHFLKFAVRVGEIQRNRSGFERRDLAVGDSDVSPVPCVGQPARVLGDNDAPTCEKDVFVAPAAYNAQERLRNWLALCGFCSTLKLILKRLS